ncbi:MAG: hypothetical protein NW208_12950 [Bryobacter sp.]|nr:hypothetical protein [Bryobacter sp.]
MLVRRRTVLATPLALATPVALFAQNSDYELHNAVLEPAELLGKAGQRMTVNRPAGAQGRIDVLALRKDVAFSSGVIEVEVAGQPASGAPGGARGFVGIAFRVQADRKTYDCFYIRPTNGRAEDQERRNHSVQYISHPDFTWEKLRKEYPSKYETYADMEPAQWVHLRVEVNKEKARLFVNRAQQPTLIVNDLKTGREAKGQVALWIEGSTIGHFANLKISA